jgi:hypothetical protein
MRDSFRALTISGALLLTVAFAPAIAQTESMPQDSGTSATPRAPINMNGQAAVSQDIGTPAAAVPATGVPATGVPAADAAKDPAADPNAPKFITPEHGDESTATNGSVPPVAIPKPDMKKALSIVRRSTRDYAPCTRVPTCSAYFDSFGVGFTFADGTIAAFSHEQRLQISGHDCVLNARSALGRGDRSMAVQWMMAAQADILNRNWIGDHPDAMLEVLRTFRGWG